ncbi:MAG: ATP synthase F0 subunit B [Treponema sp.]|jgi:F-type H+-transporting ATPase subunit b|nr:ATP synthase F0 subunit B [Treponema sp.]
MENPGLVTPNPVTFFVTIVNVGVLFFILRAILFKPVTKFMEARTKKIHDALEQSEKDKHQARALLEQYEERLKSAEGEAEIIIRQAKENARLEGERIIAQGQAQAEILIANAKRQIEAEKEAGLARFRSEAADLVAAASGRLLGREFGREDNRRYAGMILSELKDKGIGKN